MRWLTVFSLACGSSPGTPPTTDPWEVRAPLLAPLQENAVVALDGRVVVVGGIEPGSLASSRVEAYAPEADAWSPLPDLPLGRHHLNVATVDGALYVLGGLDIGFGPTGQSWVLDGDIWRDLAPIPDGRARGAAVVGVLGGRVHLVGGLAGADVAWHDVYDPVADSWTALPDAPVARDHGGGAVIDEVLYVVGGRHRAIAEHVGDLWAFDGATWTERAPMPTTRGGIAVAALDGRLHVIGGEGSPDPSGVFGVHEVWDPASNEWGERTPPMRARHGTGAVAVNGVLFLPGGADVQALGPVADHEAYLGEP